MTWLLMACTADPGGDSGAAADDSATAESGYIDIDGEHGIVCGVHSSGTIECWGGLEGGNLDEVAAIGTFSGDYVDVAVGLQFWCGLTSDGYAECEGFDGFGYGQLEPNEHSQYSAIFAGAREACGLIHGDRFECWGEPKAESLSRSDFRGVEVATLGVHGFCVRDEDDAVACDDLVEEHWADFPPSDATQIVSATSSERRMGALTPDGEAILAYQSGNPESPSGPFVDLDVAKSGACGLRPGGAVDCWGDDAVHAFVPSSEFTDIALSSYVGCGITAGGEVGCWGALDGPLYSDDSYDWHRPFPEAD